MADDQPLDILLVDGDEPSAMTEWRELCTSDGTKAALPAVIVSKANISDSKCSHLQRPLKLSHVLTTLDQVAKTQVEMRTVETPPLTALVVDDSLPVRKQVELELKILGVGADCVESAEQAFESLNRDTAYDLIFLDVILPGVDGYNLCKTIKRDQRRKRTPVIMLTGKGSTFDRVRGKLAGCDTYLTKPVARESFQEVVKKYLSQKLSHEVAIT
ncbi:MAG: response regulator [Candidatus Tectomicrobia bacterium]|nr:response regulator [Candidatus Tectomicrobia bacterium]